MSRFKAVSLNSPWKLESPRQWKIRQPAKRCSWIELLRKQNAGDIRVFGGGIIPDDDIPQLKQKGVDEIFTPGSSTQDIVKWIKEHIPARA